MKKNVYTATTIVSPFMYIPKYTIASSHIHSEVSQRPTFK